MKKTFLVAFLSLLFSSLYGQRVKDPAELKSANEILQNYLTVLLENEEIKPYEYEEAREFIYHDINGDGEKDLAAFFTLEAFGGGNNWQHILAIFILKDGEVTEVDDLILFGDSWKKYRDGELVGFKNGYIYYKLYERPRGNDKEYDSLYRVLGISMKDGKIVTSIPY